MEISMEWAEGAILDYAGQSRPGGAVLGNLLIGIVRQANVGTRLRTCPEPYLATGSNSHHSRYPASC